MISDLTPREVLPRKVLVVESFVSPVVCRQILEELRHTFWLSSGVVGTRSGHRYSEVRESFRASLTAQEEFFGPKLLRVVRQMERRLSALVGCDPKRLEFWQATRYERGGRFDYHVDCGSWKRSAAGERKRSYLLYLDTPKKGGETHFRALDVLIKPKPGRLLVWENLLPSGNCDHAIMHSGLSVRQGVKTTLVTWERERPIRKGGTRNGESKEGTHV